MSLEEALKVANKDGVYIVEIRPALPDQEWMAMFLHLLRKSNGNVQKALDSDVDGALPSKPTLYKYRRRNPVFKAKWDDILQFAGSSDDTEIQQAKEEPSR